MAAPIAAKRDGGLAGMILLSTPAQSFSDYLMETLRSSEKFSTSDDEKDRALLSGAMELLDLLQKRRLPAEEMVLSAPAQVWYDIMDQGHSGLIRQTDLPVLIIQCGDDPNISERDYETWEDIAHTRKNVSLKMYPDLNYFYQPVIAAEFPDEELIDTSPVDIRIIQDIASWIKSH
jgi:hypothetical protein